jgi:non-ribosomal peptide synthase protein (TIGR01720 family)
MPSFPVLSRDSMGRALSASRLPQDDWCRAYASDPLRRSAARDFERDVAILLGDASPGLIPDDVVAMDALPRTADGQLDRAHVPRREVPRRGSADVRKAAGPVELALARLWRDILAVDDVGRNDNFFDLGGDSRHGLQVVTQAKRLGIEITLQDLLEHQSIAELAAVVRGALATTSGVVPPQSHEIVHGAVPLGPAHRRIIEGADEDYFIERVLVLHFECRRLIRAEPLGRAIEHLVRHHDELRIELRHGASGVTLWNSASPRPLSELLSAIDLSHLPASGQSAEIARISLQLRDVTDLGRVAMLRCVLIDRGPDQNQLLLLAVHHSIWDTISAGILFDDLRATYDQAAHGRTLCLPPKTSPMKLWAERLEAEGPSAVADELDYWRERLTPEALELPLDGEPLREGEHGYRIDCSLSTRETRAIQEMVQRECDATMEEILAAGVGTAVSRWTGRSKVGIDLLQHGRNPVLDGVDVSRTLGWFTSECPLILDLSEADSVIQAVKITREAARHVPRNGLGYSILRHLDRAGPLANHPPPRIMLNHQGVGTFLTTGPLRFLSIDETFRAKHINLPTAPIHLTSRVVGGALQMLWVCNQTVAKEATIRALQRGTVRALRELVAER